MIRALEYGRPDDRAAPGDRFAWLMWGYAHCTDPVRRSQPPIAAYDRDVAGEQAPADRAPTGDGDVEEIAL